MPSSSQRKRDFEEEARQAAIDVEDMFESYSNLRNDNLAAMVALFDPEEIVLGKPMKSSGDFAVAALRGISLRYERDPPFDYEMEDARDRFADRSHDAFFAIKSLTPGAVKRDGKSAAAAGASLMLEVKILMNLEKHPHICQVYGLSASGPMASFGSEYLEENFFLIIDAISETLPERMKAWKEKKGYEGERFDDLASRQSRLTQRLEVALEIASAMTFLANRKLVYFLHPEKVGFDVRYKRIKLFQFGMVRESGKDPYYEHEEENMKRRVYLAPEVLGDEPVTVSADVFALGMLIWEILTLTGPLDGMSREMHIKGVIDGRTRPQLNRAWPADLRQLMEDCWAHTAAKRPTMKQAYDRLEGCLLFQDFNGIDKTENHSRNVVEKPQNRKIKYQRNATEPITEEAEKDRDDKSTRSRESVRSKESARSRRSNDPTNPDKKVSRSRHGHSQDKLRSSSSRHQTDSDHRSTSSKGERVLRTSRRKSFSSDPDSQEKPSSSRHHRNAENEERSTRTARNFDSEDFAEDEMSLNDVDETADRRRTTNRKSRRSKSRDRRDNDARSVSSRSKSRDAKGRRPTSSRDGNSTSGKKPTRRKSYDPSRMGDSSSGPGIQAILDATDDTSSVSTPKENRTGVKHKGRQRSPRRNNGDEAKDEVRRSRSKSSSSERHLKGPDRISKQSSSRKMSSSREINSRKLGRSKSDDTGGSDAFGREHSSRRLARHKSSDGVDLAKASPGRSPGSLRPKRVKATEAYTVSTPQRQARESAVRKLSRNKSISNDPGREVPTKRGVQRTHSADGHPLTTALGPQGLLRGQGSQSTRTLSNHRSSSESVEDNGDDEEPGRLRKLRVSKSGVLHAAPKDATKDSRSMQKAKSSHDAEPADRARQRRDEHVVH